MTRKLLHPLFLLVVITLLAAVLRLVFLNIIPAAIGGDELTYILTSKAMYLYGSDITRTWNPLSIFIFHYPQGTMQAELPYFLNLPVVGFFPFSLFTARVTTALFSIGIIPLMYFIALRLFKDVKAALFAAFLTAINPWMIYIGRTAYEQSPATFFFLLAFLVIISAKGKTLLWAIPALILAFYAYIGTKVFFLPFVIVSTWYSYFVLNNKKYRQEFLIIVGASIFLMGFFAVSIMFKSGGNRTGDLILPNTPQIGSKVDLIRRASIANPITNLYENKYAEFVRILVTKFYKSTSPDYLFVSGDQFSSIARHGLFYIIDFAFLLIGAFVILSKNKKLALLLFLLFLISLIPQLLYRVSIDNFTPHILFIFPIFILVMSFGITQVVDHFKKRTRIASVLLVGIYMVLLVNFMQIYLFQFPLQDFFDFGSRNLSTYAQRASINNDVIVYSTNSSEYAKKYEFYTNQLKNLTSGPYVFDRVVFTTCPNKPIDYKDGKTHVLDINCGINTSKFKSFISLANLKDGGATFKIIGDKICDSSPLHAYPNGITLQSLQLEKLSNDDFCKTFVVRQ